MEQRREVTISSHNSGNKNPNKQKTSKVKLFPRKPWITCRSAKMQQLGCRPKSEREHCITPFHSISEVCLLVLECGQCKDTVCSWEYEGSFGMFILKASSSHFRTITSGLTCLIILLPLKSAHSPMATPRLGLRN